MTRLKNFDAFKRCCGHGFLLVFQASPTRTAGTTAAIVLEESPLSQGARRRREVWELVKQGPQLALRTVEAKRECA
ncbi:hypothetical protein BRM22_05880 [Xanthomonas oryzae pv. oryzae]|nr:hypothetical protein BRM60_02340 [Xanthomonas oryzae pv. oryzae]AXM15317.1 hypothetical protein BRN32_02420 [Xanthomonas oryzae pv. oryzae]AXM19057.1 hypothetical protein BRN66_02370 [Xanthomonas oryzae pv. oryzae]AXM22917.1 hypothetical protein BRM88_02375 [Xanthomonas oryzae pv. oryzae]AXM26748.1 hypothetical protein BRM77_02360 [Xanthomonas oryzae pv. oryzae]